MYTPGYRNRFGHPRRRGDGALRRGGHPHVSHRLRRRADVHVRSRTPRGRRAPSASVDRRYWRDCAARAPASGSDAATRCASHRLSRDGLARRTFSSDRSPGSRSHVMLRYAARIRACARRAARADGAQALGRRRTRVRARQGRAGVGECDQPGSRRHACRERSIPVRRSPERDPAREFAALRDGAADLAVGSTLFWSTQVNALAVVGLPWIAAEPDGARTRSPRGEVRERLFAAIERAGAVPLALAPLGHRAIATTTRSVRTPGDVAGLAIRIASTPYLVELYAGLARPAARGAVRRGATRRSARARSTRRKARSRRSPRRASTRSDSST